MRRSLMKQTVISLIALLLLSVVSCSQAYEPVLEPLPVPTTSPPPSPTPAPAPIPTPTPANYQELSFTLQIPDGNDWDGYDFPIYLGKDETLHLSFWLEEGSGIWFGLFTPSGKYFGLTEDGYLSEGSCSWLAWGTIIFKPLQYGCEEGYYLMEPHIISGVSEYSEGGKARVLVRYWIEAPVPAPSTTTPVTTPASAGKSTSEITSDPSTYNGKEVELSGQTFLAGNSAKLLVDSKSGINLVGNTANIQKGFYRLKGLYDAVTNTLNVAEAVKQEVNYTTIEAGAEAGISLTAVAVQGLVATPPKEVANMLSSYLSIPNLPKDVHIYPYVVYGKDGFYLALSDTLIDLPAKFTFLYQGKDYSFTFSAGELKGTLVKTPLEQIDFGLGWMPGEFGGVIITDTIAPLKPEEATVREINASPGNFIFKRVSINGSYIVTTATVDYSDIKAPMGQGILADEFSDFFKEDTKARLETIDPNTRVWQLRRGEVVGTVIFPTDQILKYFDYSAPLSQAEVKGMLKPALIVDTLVDDVEEVADISELNPVLGNPSRYWGKVVEFDGYALGINYPLKEAAKAVLNTEVPVNVNLLAIGIADKPTIGSQLAIIGFNNELIGEQGEGIKGKYRFKVAVTQVP
jgi:hypothetical protein